MHPSVEMFVCFSNEWHPVYLRGRLILHGLRGILEQVPGFDNTFKQGDFVTRTPLNLFVERLGQIQGTDGQPLYTGIQVLQMDASTWVEVPRSRTAEHRSVRKHSQHIDAGGLFPLTRSTFLFMLPK